MKENLKLIRKLVDRQMRNTNKEIREDITQEIIVEMLKRKLNLGSEELKKKLLSYQNVKKFYRNSNMIDDTQRCFRNVFDKLGKELTFDAREGEGDIERYYPIYSEIPSGGEDIVEYCMGKVIPEKGRKVNRKRTLNEIENNWE